MPTATLQLDLQNPLPPFRPLHGVNNGPWCSDGLVDTSPFFRSAYIPDVRLHDVHYPGRTVVDINAVFPDMSRDPADPAGYDFARTDHYLKSIADIGATVTYRLGYTIDHHPIKRYCDPPKNFDHFAQVCAGIVRHYNANWAQGFTNLVGRWEIWNEPDLRSSLDTPGLTSPTWRASWRDYSKLYEITAQAIKQAVPQAQVGGPAMVGGGITSGFLEHFLSHCSDHQLPLDFLSWHTYTSDVPSVAADARAVHRLLQSHGYPHAKNLLTEWHYIPPGMDWAVIMTPTPPAAKRQLLAEMNSSRSAAFTAATLLLLADSPLDMSHFYTADTIFFFGAFDAVGAPLKPFYALQAYAQLTTCPQRIAVGGSTAPNLYAGAALTADNHLRLLLVNHSEEYLTIQLPTPPTATCTLLSSEHDQTPWPLTPTTVSLPPQSLATLEWPL